MQKLIYQSWREERIVPDCTWKILLILEEFLFLSNRELCKKSYVCTVFCINENFHFTEKIKNQEKLFAYESKCFLFGYDDRYKGKFCLFGLR